jgi:hypothetical protein
MFKSVVLTLIVLLSLIAAPAFAQSGLVKNEVASITSQACGESTVVTLFAGQHIDAGSVTVWNDVTNLYVRYEATGGWDLAETHLAVATSLDGIPQKRGNPAPGQFPYKTTHLPTVTGYTYTIPLGAFAAGDELFVAAHASLVLLDEAGRVIQQETGWGDGFDFAGRNWATYFNFTVQLCGEDGGTGCTLTQGYWRTHSSYGPARYNPVWATVGEDTPFYLSGKTWYTALWASPRGDAYYILAQQYIAATLNVNGGASAPAEVQATLEEALAWLESHEPGVRPRTATGQMLVGWAKLLDDYNNGEIGPGHCD